MHRRKGPHTQYTSEVPGPTQVWVETFTSQPMWQKLSDSNISGYPMARAQHVAGWDDPMARAQHVARSTMWCLAGRTMELRSCLRLPHLAMHTVSHHFNWMSSNKESHCLLTGVLSEWQWQRRLAEFLSQQMVAGGGKFHITNDSKLDIKLTANLNTKLSTGRETQCTRRKDTFAFSQ